MTMYNFRVWLPDLEQHEIRPLFELLATVWDEGWARGHEDCIEMGKVPELGISDNPYRFNEPES